MEELFDTFDRNGNFLGTQTKSFCHGENPGVFHKTVGVWIVNDKGELLIQKRAKSKRYQPSKWDMPSAGHVKTGETVLKACVRETNEELGIDTKESDFIFLKEWLRERTWEIVRIYLLKTNTKIEEFKLQNDEVSEVKYLSYNNFVKFIYSDEFSNHDKEYKDWSCEELKKYIEV